MVNNSPKMNAMAPHIVEIRGNDKGCDFVTTDPHGCLDVLKIVVDELKEHDRLFLCGDLVDRGPKSLETIRYLVAQKNAGKVIHAIRGNHEDMVLLAIEKAAILQENALTNSNNRIPTEIANRLLSLAKEYKYGGSNKKLLEDFYHFLESYEKFCANTPQLTDSASKKILREICEFYTSVVRMIINGAGWVFSLNESERNEVKAFIEPLPYMIRVNEAKKGTISAFDIVHAAPLPEIEIETALQSKNKEFTKKQIGYVTWARPAESKNARKEIEDNPTLKANNEDTQRTIVSHERNKCSIPAYVGHNALKSSFEVYPETNVINLDVATVETHAMCVANHTDGSLNLVKSTEVHEQCTTDVSAIPGISSKLDESFEAAQKIMPQVMRLSSSIDTDLISIATTNITKELSGNTSSPEYTAVDQDVSKTQAQKEIPEASLKSFKKHYLSALRNEMSKMTKTQKIGFARYLLETKNHPLAKERDYTTTKTCCFWGRSSEHSHQTRSMHKAIGMLLQGINSTETTSIQKSLLSATKVTLKQEENVPKIFTFDRYRRYI